MFKFLSQLLGFKAEPEKHERQRTAGTVSTDAGYRPSISDGWPSTPSWSGQRPSQQSFETDRLRNWPERAGAASSSLRTGTTGAGDRPAAGLASFSTGTTSVRPTYSSGSAVINARAASGSSGAYVAASSPGTGTVGTGHMSTAAAGTGAAVVRPIRGSGSADNNARAASTGACALPTSAVSVVSHTHGRQRREERGIDKRQLQEAVKYGRKERANPGRDGQTRWRYTHRGIVYVTDETSRHEVTSWKLENALEAPPPVPGEGGRTGTPHVVVVVDSSGSMRKDDVPGYNSRTAAVYDCLARDLVEPQLKVEGDKLELSLIEMSDTATVLKERCSVGQDLLAFLRRRAYSRARSHGNYLPALDEALRLLAGDAARQSQLFLIFLSDGAPSDHTEMECCHGSTVWQPCPSGRWLANGRPALTECPVSKRCRRDLKLKVHQDCVKKVKSIGDLLGRDRVFISTVAFGPPSENYDVLQSMAEALPRGSFQKLGLSAACLRTAFTSLTSSLTSLRTEAGDGVASSTGLTLRTDITLKGERQMYDQQDVLKDGVDWNLYCGLKCIGKRRYVDGNWVPVGYSWEAQALLDRFSYLKAGIAHASRKFGEGAERVVFQCTEVVSPDDGKTALCVGPRLVGKSTRFYEHLENAEFHRTFCRTQGEAEELAQLFNRRLRGGPEWQVHFLPCFVYTIEDYRYSRRGVMDILVEQELEGRFTKWNNNNGGVARGMAGTDNKLLGAIVEDDEEEEGEEGSSCGGGGSGEAFAEHVPQCFSHFTYFVTERQKLVCDLQGVWNSVDGFVLTDPVIHHHTGSKRNGATDKGPAGIRSFFATHVCNPLCRRLGLPPGPTC